MIDCRLLAVVRTSFVQTLLVLFDLGRVLRWPDAFCVYLAVLNEFYECHLCQVQKYRLMHCTLCSVQILVVYMTTFLSIA